MHRFVVIALLFTLASCQRKPLVNDEAGVFTPEQIAQLELFHGFLLQDHDIDYRVVTTTATDDINGFAARRFKELDAGELSSASLGLMLVIDETGRKVRMEVGYGLEGYFPDAFVAYVENRQMAPFFAAGRPADGVLATTELIVDQAQKYALGSSSESNSSIEGSGGAGATARIGREEVPVPKSGGSKLPAGQSPAQTLNTYFTAMEHRNLDPNLPIYNAETQTMLQDWVMTAAQADTVVRSYRACQPQAAKFDQRQQHAVIRYPVKQRKCAPWFFTRSGDRWQLDLTMMSRAVRFGRDNSWRFDLSVSHPYEFAFTDWRFDPNGFPLEEN